jgi:hypothetical protein
MTAKLKAMEPNVIQRSRVNFRRNCVGGLVTMRVMGYTALATSVTELFLLARLTFLFRPQQEGVMVVNQGYQHSKKAAGTER